MSFFGMPMTWDGAFPTEACIYIPRIDALTEDGWAYLYKTRQINWVIIPLESQNHGNHANPGGPEGNGHQPQA